MTGIYLVKLQRRLTGYRILSRVAFHVIKSSLDSDKSNSNLQCSLRAKDVQQPCSWRRLVVVCHCL